MDSEFFFDDTVQKDILCLFLQDGDFCSSAIDWVEPTYFSEKSDALLCKIVFDFFKAHNIVPTIGQVKTEISRIDATSTISESSLKSIASILNDAKEGRAIASKSYTIQTVASFAKQKMWTEAVIKASDYITKNDFAKVEEIMEAAKLKSFEVNTGGVSYFERVEERVRRKGTEDGHVDFFPTGIAELDLLCFQHGGVCRKELGMLLAPKGGGKSIGLTHMARRALWCGYKVAYYSFEMSEERIEERFDASFSGIAMRDMNEEKERLLEKIKPLQVRFRDSLYIKEFPTKGASVNDIRKNLDQLLKKKGWMPDLLIFDYATIIKPAYRREDRHIEIQEVVEDLRGLCIERNCAGWTAAQLNRGGARKEIAEGDDAAGSWDQLATLDYIFTINRNNEDRANQYIKLFVDKSRTGKDKFVAGPFETSWDRMQWVRPSGKNPVEILKEYGVLTDATEKAAEELAAKERYKGTSKDLFFTSAPMLGGKSK